MDKVFVKGQKLFITTEECTYDATFHSMDNGKTRLTVKNVVKHPSEESFDGLYHFYKDEIIGVHILDPIPSAWMTPGSESVSSKITSIMHGNYTHTVVRPTPKFHETSELSKDHYQYYLNLLKKFVIIDDVGTEFELAVEEIQKQKLIGVSFEGARLGRKGRLSWICISIPYREDDEDEPKFIHLDPIHRNQVPSRVTVYLFDIAVMGSVAISKGLGEILSGKDSPTKVIFDCRLPSDCLYHQFDLVLENVADAQVAQMVMYRPKCRSPDVDGSGTIIFTRGLHQSLFAGLNLPPHLVYQPHIRDGYFERDTEIWFQRPITTRMAKAAAYQTIYLMNIWAKYYFRNLYHTYLIGVKIFLSCVRDADDEKALTYAYQYYMVPDEFVPYLLKCHNLSGKEKNLLGRAPNSKPPFKNIAAQK